MPKTRSEPVALAGGPTIAAEVTDRRILAIHDPLDDAGGYILTHIPSGKVVLRARLKSSARALVKELEALDWSNPEALRPIIEERRTSL